MKLSPLVNLIASSILIFGIGLVIPLMAGPRGIFEALAPFLVILLAVGYTYSISTILGLQNTPRVRALAFAQFFSAIVSGFLTSIQMHSFVNHTDPYLLLAMLVVGLTLTYTIVTLCKHAEAAIHSRGQ